MANITVISKQNGVAIELPGNNFALGDPDGDFVAENGSVTGYINIKRSINNKYIAKELYYTSVKDESGATIGTSGATCVSLLNSDYLNTTTKIQSFDNVNFQNTIAKGQVLTFTDQSGSLKVDNVAPSIETQLGTAPTNAGEFQAGARLINDIYGTSPSATAGNLVNLAATNVSNVGAQSAAAAATGMLLMVTDAGTGDELVVEGVVRLSSTTTTALLPTNAKKGAPVYMSTTAGAVTNTAPSTAGDFVRVVGHILDATNRTIYFKPSVDWIEL
jgi:hypothetical protein